VITLGVLFLIGEFTRWDFGRTWPVLLIVIGVVKVVGSSADIHGHIAPFGLGVSGPPPAGSTPPPEAQPPYEVPHV